MRPKEKETSMTFEEIVANFIPSSVAEVTSAIASGKDMIVFLGRSSCPYCRRFAPKLAQVATDNRKDVYFVDSENAADAAELAAFRENYQLVTVPALLVSYDQHQRAVCDSSLTPDDILAFLTRE
ncbi:TPA: thioredoxin domain-containing protein [Streptococcus pyogenes]|uniref:thioredoxin domain-containing protein n=1 Tax=Streptococcus pyogenes TaxID=1314 RepID=UPI0001E10249|nr:thioredoxin domain-containing protein [Streptococcus pyogenes]HER4566837.1 thiol reductase thioredoxin [Streptococcus pyogenes NGAS629]HER4575695.1 thiol reductase thioredoxin [Streptococcus pyogenes NGAS643]HER4578819.1 thiol reductase thioredoxin [Streptococcus pyogenes NGAS633]HER4584205.1 thiol reductase thioredoxin [Streptococcus pyogenes NGAS655]HER4604047.1 thiol reductase thioredoxin [Streptococcus pyogenes NGAS620]HER4714055.1 thiol reductase thioredoxin [Streptococcus pyogenes NG